MVYSVYYRLNAYLSIIRSYIDHIRIRGDGNNNNESACSSQLVKCGGKRSGSSFKT